jgi:thiol-disulfide isomerase/thioredoxin
LVHFITQTTARTPTPSQSLVIPLTKDNFDDILRSQPYTLINFHTSWCGNCKKFQPVWDGASIALEKKSKLASVECNTENDSICTRFKIQAYPTILGFDRETGLMTEYSDSRTVEGIVGFVYTALTPPFTRLTSNEDLDDFKRGPGKIHLLIRTAEGSELAKMVEFEARRDLKKYVSIALIDPSIDLYPRPGPSLIQLTRYEDNTVIDMGIGGKHQYFSVNLKTVSNFGGFDPVISPDQVGINDIREFVLSNLMPLFGKIDAGSLKAYQARGLPIGWMFIDFGNEKHILLIESLMPLAQKYINDITFVQLDRITWKKHAEVLGLGRGEGNNGKQLGLVIQEPNNGSKYVYPLLTGNSLPVQLNERDDIDLDEPEERKLGWKMVDIEWWVERYLEGGIIPHLKSQPVSISHESSPHSAIQQIVGLNFKEVIGSGRDVVVYFYTKSCGHCKAFAPKFDSVAHLFHSVKDFALKFVKIDMDENDLPDGYQKLINGCPTVMLFTPGEGYDAGDAGNTGNTGNAGNAGNAGNTGNNINTNANNILDKEGSLSNRSEIGISPVNAPSASVAEVEINIPASSSSSSSSSSTHSFSRPTTPSNLVLYTGPRTEEGLIGFLEEYRTKKPVGVNDNNNVDGDDGPNSLQNGPNNANGAGRHNSSSPTTDDLDDNSHLGDTVAIPIGRGDNNDNNNEGINVRMGNFNTHDDDAIEVCDGLDTVTDVVVVDETSSSSSLSSRSDDSTKSHDEL